MLEVRELKSNNIFLIGIIKRIVSKSSELCLNGHSADLRTDDHYHNIGFESISGSPRARAFVSARFPPLIWRHKGFVT